MLKKINRRVIRVFRPQKLDFFPINEESTEHF